MTARTAIRYLLAISAAIAALSLRGLLIPLLGLSNPYHTVWLAIVFSAWYCGLGPSIVATAISIAGVWYFFLPPVHFFAIVDRTEVYGMIGFVIFSASIIAFGEASRHASASLLRLAAIVDSSEDAIISHDLQGNITSWNEGAKYLFGWTALEAIGQPITIIVPPDMRDECAMILERIRSGRPVERLETMRTTKTGKRVDVSLTISLVKDRSGRVVGGSMIAADISDRKHVLQELEEARHRLEERVRERTVELLKTNLELKKQADTVQNLSARLLQLQDEERRRIARELHDSVGQILAAVNMNVSRVSREKDKLSPKASRCVEENKALIGQALTEIRTISHLLHPPLLDEIGLGSAIQWYVEGFSKRSNIEVALDISAELDRLPSDHEIALFRAMQECLTNIHRHSGSAKASIRLAKKDGAICLECSDQGKGIAPEKQQALSSSGVFGVGLHGMRERVRQLGGNLQVQSSNNGTVVTLTLPTSDIQKAAAADSRV